MESTFYNDQFSAEIIINKTNKYQPVINFIWIQDIDITIIEVRTSIHILSIESFNRHLNDKMLLSIKH
jgi:hypothetical protein